VEGLVDVVGFAMNIETSGRLSKRISGNVDKGKNFVLCWIVRVVTFNGFQLNESITS
jgi:hypothetical protein